MSKFEALSDKAISLVGQAGTTLRQAIPETTGKYLQAGAALGAARTGTKIAGSFVRRNPAVVAASVIGVGLVWVAARQYRKRKANGVVEGSARRVEAEQQAAPEGQRRTRSRRKRAVDLED